MDRDPANESLSFSFSFFLFLLLFARLSPSIFGRFPFVICVGSVVVDRDGEMTVPGELK